MKREILATTTKLEIRLQCSVIDDVNDLSEFYLREPISLKKISCKYVNPFLLFVEWIFLFKRVQGCKRFPPL